MMHPDTQLRFIGGPLGFGVVATRRIPKGTIIWALDELDRRLSPADLAALPARTRAAFERWTFVEGHEYILCWDHGRYGNHSCDPSCAGAGWGFDMALRDIQPGEELTDDYGRIQAAADFVCRCGSPRCRTIILSDGTDLARYGASWDAEVDEALPFITEVRQPLWDWVSPAAKEAISRARRRMDESAR